MKVYLSIPHRFELSEDELADIIRTYKIKIQNKYEYGDVEIINTQNDVYLIFGDTRSTIARMIVRSLTSADIIVYTSKERDDLVIFEKDVANYIKLPGVTIL